MLLILSFFVWLLLHSVHHHVWQYPADRPPLSQPTKVLMTIRIVYRFFSSLARGISHFFTNTQNTQPRGWKKKKNKQSRAWVSARMEKSVTLLCILWANASVYSNETPTKPLGLLTHFLALVNPASSNVFLDRQLPQLLSTGLFSWLVCSAHFPRLLCPADCLTRAFLPSSSSSLVGDLARKPFLWASRQNRQRNLLTGTYTHTHRNECHRSCHTRTLFIITFLYVSGGIIRSPLQITRCSIVNLCLISL